MRHDEVSYQGSAFLHGGGSCREALCFKSFVPDATALLGLSGLSAKRPGLDRLPCTGRITPPQTPGSGHEYKSLYDGWYVYPQAKQRIVPQIQGPFYRNYYGGYRLGRYP